ncbi:MAG: LiaI-LiaF-like domain-containing protein, partial [Terriglobales bacterium]
LGMIPGVGAAYNGQFTKAFVHVVVFAMLIVVEHDDSDLTGLAHGLMILAFVAYQMVDAYRTARARQLGQPAPEDFLGLGQGLGTPGGKLAEAPIGAIILVVMGVAFLLRNMDIIRFGSVGRLWPLILIFIGIRMFQRRGYWKS